jgi:2-polyprenyl-3-methyl-5-hydroxy-6-metoxy-1,4-benzoquinol methylase
MSDSFFQTIRRLGKFARRFIQNPKLASYDLAKYLFSKLPDFLQRHLRALLRPLTQLQTRIPSSTSNRPPNLVADIASQFYVPETFVRLFREQGHGPINWSSSNWQDFFDNLPPLQKLSVPFAMSTVIRGRTMLALLENQSCIHKKDRYLDVGTGYGGFLRAAKETGFKEVVGIELQQDLVDLASANVQGLSGAQVLKEDFLTGDFSGIKGFDLITCNDVIEHVDDPHLAIQKMSALTNENGCICFEVPNKDAIEFVKADGHFLIFGITQLPRDQAAEYHAAYTGTEKSVYYFEMGEMYELEWYFRELRDNGFSAFIADTHSIGEIEDVPRLVDGLKQAYESWLVETKPKLDIALAKRITSAVEAYVRDLEQDLSNLSDAQSKIRFKNKYLRTFWTIIATRN